MTKNLTHGGKRKGAGRPTGTTTALPTVVMRIPLVLVSKVKKLINDLK